MAVPGLRFKNFDFEWKKAVLGDFTKINQGLQIPIVNRYLTPSENRHFYITNEFLNPQSKKRYYIEDPPPSVKCNEADILMTRTGNTGKVVTNVSGAFHNNFFRIKYDKSVVVKDFLVAYLRQQSTQKLILRLAGLSTIPDLNHKDFYKIPIALPTIEEQQKIADFFTFIDCRIEKQQEKVAALEEQKKGLLQKIFSREFRFKDVDGKEFPEWEETQLKDVCMIVGGGTPATSEPSFWNGAIQWFTPSEITKSGKYVQESERTISELGLIKSAAKMLPEGSILLTSRATLGDMAILKKPATTNQGFQSIIPSKNVVTEFLYYLQPQIKKFCYKQASGSTFLEISKKEIEKFKFHIPVYKEQKKIASVLSLLDIKINKEQNKLYYFKEQKKGFMQQMFI